MMISNKINWGPNFLYVIHIIEVYICLLLCTFYMKLFNDMPFVTATVEAEKCI